MDGIRAAKPVSAAPRPRFKCAQAECGATFNRQWKLKEHETVHTGARPCQCTVSGCGRRFSRKAHLKRHLVQHKGVKQFKCKFSSTCAQSFFSLGKLRRHVGFAHADKAKFFKCVQPNCSSSFKKRRHLKLHLKEHGASAAAAAAAFKCTKDGCDAKFDSHVARRAHEKKHAGYRCPHADCQVLEHTWGKMKKHMSKHPATFTCKVCSKQFKKADTLRRHKLSHASHKPVLVCPRSDCQAYFSTTFNLQHHIRKVHLELLKYKCSFPDCPRMFAMRESMNRHLLLHDPSAATVKKRQRARKPWQKRLNGNKQPLVEENLRRLFALRMRISRRAKVETNLHGLFNERKIPHYIDPEVNLRDLFGIKQPRPVEEPAEVVPSEC